MITAAAAAAAAAASAASAAAHNATAAAAAAGAARYSGPPEEWPSPRGLLMGYAGVFIGQAVVLAYYCVRRFVLKSPTIQLKPPPDTTLAVDLWSHVSKPESFLMVMGYLALVWMFRILPESYYNLDAPVDWWHVFLQFVIVDFFTYVDHLIEHQWRWFYGKSHKAHHKFVSPKLYNAFNGAPLDTFSLIVIPLVLTSQLVHASTWSFMAFGCLYASVFTLIHCEYEAPWDPVLSAVGIGVAADHHVHHALFKFNFGHFFTWYDRLFGTYMSPHDVKRFAMYAGKEEGKKAE